MKRSYSPQNASAPLWVRIAAALLLAIGVVGVTITSVNIVRAATLSSQQQTTTSHHFDISPFSK